MSDRLTFSLASLILIFVAGFALLIPGTAEADSVTVPNVAAQTWDTTAAITSVTLGAATHAGDTAFTYSLSPTPPAGIKFNAATRVLSGTATKGMKQTTYTYTATGNTTSHVGSVDFTIEVQTSPTFDDAYKGNTATERLKLGYKAGTGNRIINLPVATDEDGDPLTYALAGTPPTGFNFDAGNPGLGTLPSIYGSADTVPDPASAELTYTATDNDNNAVTLYLTFTVEADLKPMLAVISNITATVDTAIKNVPLPLVPAANINAGETITYALTPNLPAGLSYSEILPGTWVLSGTPTKAAAEAEYVWTATDPDGDKAESKFKITVNAIPVAVSFGGSSIGDKTFTVGTYTESLLPPEQQGTGVSPLTFSLTPKVPAGLTFNAATRVLSGTPTTATAAAEYTYKVEDSADPKTSAMLKFMIAVSDTGGTTPPPAGAPTTAPSDLTAPAPTGTSLAIALSWTALADVTGYEVKVYKGDTVAAVTDAATTAAATIDDITGTSYTYTAVEADRGKYFAFTVAGVNASGAGVHSARTTPVMIPPTPVTPVDPAALKLTPAEIPDQTFYVGKAITSMVDGKEVNYIQLPVASGGPTRSYTYSLHKGIGKLDVTETGDNGLTVDLVNLRLLGKPVDKDTAGRQYTWRVTDAQGHGDIEAVVEIDFTITVANSAPEFPTSPLNISGNVGQRIASVNVGATDVDGDELTYTWDVPASLGLGLTLTPSTGLISGTPTKEHTGTYMATADDGDGGTATRTVNITIGPRTADGKAPTAEIVPLDTRTVWNPATAQVEQHWVGDPSDSGYKKIEFDLIFSEPMHDPPSVSRVNKDDLTVTGWTRLAHQHENKNSPFTDFTWELAEKRDPEPHDAGYRMLGDISTTGISGEYKEAYRLTVTIGNYPAQPIGYEQPPIELHVKLSKANVLSVRDEQLAEDVEFTFDTIPPGVEITPGEPTFDSNGNLTNFTAATKNAKGQYVGEPLEKVAFKFAFTEKLNPSFSTTDIHRSVGADNFELLKDSGPHTLSGMDPYTYFVVATTIEEADPTTILIKKQEVWDEANNQSITDARATYTPTTQRPVVTITATDPFNCGVAGNSVTVTIKDSEGLKVGETITADEITVSQGWKIATRAPLRAFSATKAAAGATSVTATFNVIRNDVETPSDRSWLGIQEVTITVAKDAVMDDTDQGNLAGDEDYTAGPVITIPANMYVVVVRDNAWHTSHLNDVRTLYLGDYNVRADNVDVQGWDCMPDLGLIFDVTVDASPGIGGGGLMVLQSRDHTGTKIVEGTVGISEIMWSEDRGIPFGNLSNLQHAREQWIELHNTNNFEVKVTLFDLIRTEAYRTNANTGSYPLLVDVMGNYDIGDHWDVQEKLNDNGTPDDKSDDPPKYGSDGNSERGYDFVSMQRRTPEANKNYAHGEKQGRNKAHWTASPAVYLTRRAGLADRGIQLPYANLNYDFRGSPGRNNTFSAPGPITRTNVPKNSIVFNEIANRSDETLEWIELKNVSTGLVNLKNYQISIVTEKGKDEVFYTFPNNDNTQIAAGELLLLVDTDPRDNDAHPVAVGYNIHAGNDQALGIGVNPKRDASGAVIAHTTGDAPRYMVTNFAQGGLPNDGEFVLILRNGNDKRGTHEKIIDLIGWDDDLKDASKHTDLWPLNYVGVPDTRNQIAVETVHYRQALVDPDQNTHGDDKDEHQALRDAGYTGVGYKRHAQRIAAHGGTPGDTDIRKSLSDGRETRGTPHAVGQLTISEIMFDQGDGDYPQWIEIYNSSPTEAINLHADDGWRLIIENYDNADDAGVDPDDVLPLRALNGTLNFKNSDVQTILPQQTVMITSTRARNSGSAFFDTRVIFPATRVFSVWDDQRAEFDMTRSDDPILSERGFYIQLIDGKGKYSDGVGNLIKSPNRRVAAKVEWEWSAVNENWRDKTKEARSSILRRYRETDKDVDQSRWKRYDDSDLAEMGIMADGWIFAYRTKFRDVRETWYGHDDDMASPGITGGRVLPVSLSKFRPERMKDTGEIVIRWITESELNNAGFNILRSETRDGAFKQINTELIAGKGTTSERHTYEWKDTSAKPNVVYYYQIQDVSLDGEVTTLRQSRLKGNVSAAGKATTTWGEIKALQ